MRYFWVTTSVIMCISISQSLPINDKANDTILFDYNKEDNNLDNNIINDNNINVNKTETEENNIVNNEPDKNIRNEVILTKPDNRNIIGMIIADIVKRLFEALMKIDFTQMYSEENLQRLAVFISSIIGFLFGPNSEILRSLAVPMISNFALFLLRYLR